MTKYIASFAILSGAQLGSRIWPDWQKSSAALLLPLSSFPIDKRTEESLGQLPWATGQPLCCSTIAMIKYKYRRFGRPLSTVLSTLAWTLAPCAVDWFSRSDYTMESRKNWGSVCVISDQLFLSEASSRTLSIQLGGHILTISTTSYRHWRKE